MGNRKEKRPSTVNFLLLIEFNSKLYDLHIFNQSKTINMANSTEPGEVETVPTEEVASASSCIDEEKTSPIDETGGGGGEPEDESMEKVEFKVIFNKKILDRGKPDDLMPGRKAGKDSLPVQPLSGMLNKHGGKVRLTFKMDLSQVWIGTKERTEKVPFSSIKSVVSEPIPDHEEYHILALQLGPTEASRYYIYWLPAQYIDAIKDAVLGRWQL